jgi:hypothetical protein
VAPILTCFAHQDFPRQQCPDCVAIKNSAFLAMVRTARKGTPTPDEQRELERVAERFEGPEGFIRAAGFTVAGEVGE